MKKKPKISYRELASPAANPPAGETVAPVPAPRRISSPVEVAAIMRSTPPEGMRPVPPPTPVPLPQTVEDYAASLMRRLAAMAPSEIDDTEQLEAQRRPLRERVRDRHGVADLLMFRIGDELFAADLASVEEAVTLPEIHHLPEMPVAMLGAFNLRGRLTPVYSPSHVIGVPLRGVAQAALLVHAGERRLGLAVDDVEDVFQVDLATVREAPGTDDADGILLGVAHHGTELVAIVDAEALVAACVTGHAMEITA
jgi:purine-binding chemotaxis protein CheW